MGLGTKSKAMGCGAEPVCSQYEPGIDPPGVRGGGWSTGVKTQADGAGVENLRKKSENIKNVRLRRAI